ncbi:hypothetical protein M501DRAFT_986871 [Patellaria atrata CBS 101060]|uniref:2EXR domain-containing protein n=1 Tax=Patellaria atrata CBS 101060 TaxID=1346257 RepID=A0A9P4S6X2_9PEZI|nr:hypothetical protein M501DRAFT_986871 [Patellaria atrata CBS 101060]
MARNVAFSQYLSLKEEAALAAQCFAKNYRQDFGEDQYDVVQFGKQFNNMFTSQKTLGDYTHTQFGEMSLGWSKNQFCADNAARMDPVIRSVIRGFEELQMSHFAAYVFEWKIIPATSAPVLFLTLDGFSEPKTYTLMYGGESVTYFFKAERSAKNASVLVYAGGKWTPAMELFKSLIGSTHMSEDEMTRNQSRWYLTNGKQFDFKNLPKELRLMIYEFHFSKEIRPYSWRNGKRTKVVHKKDYYGPTTLLQVSSQVRAEARPIFFSVSPVIFESLDTFRLFTLRIRTDILKKIKNIDIQLSHSEYCWLFGAPTAKIPPREPDKMAYSLLYVSSLTLTMPHPFEMRTFRGFWDDRNGYYSGTKFIGCQRAAVNTILGAARPFVQHLSSKTLRIKGCCKRDQVDWFFRTLDEIRGEDGFAEPLAYPETRKKEIKREWLESVLKSGGDGPGIPHEKLLERFSCHCNPRCCVSPTVPFYVEDIPVEEYEEGEAQDDHEIKDMYSAP